MTIDGLTTVPSKYAPEETIARLETAIVSHKMTIFARIDHAAGAAEVGLALRPTFLLIFGAAKGGTPLMQKSQTVGIDLPLKFLIWQDEAGATQISYNRPSWIGVRHGVEIPQIIAAMATALNDMASLS